MGNEMMNVCLFMHVFVSACARVRACVCVGDFVRACVRVCMHMGACVRACVPACVPARLHYPIVCSILRIKIIFVTMMILIK